MIKKKNKKKQDSPVGAAHLLCHSAVVVTSARMETFNIRTCLCACPQEQMRITESN